MKIRKLLAAASAAIVGSSVLAVCASANEGFLMFTDSAWGWGCWSTGDFPEGNCDVTGDGTYTVYIDSSYAGSQVEDEETGEMVGAVASGVNVFCVDIDDLANGNNCGKDAEGYENCTTAAEKMAFAKAAGIEVSNVTITTYNSDGTSTNVPVDMSKIIFGDIEGNGKIRIEIYNAYGDTSKDAPINPDDINFDEKIAVTFTISGLGGGAPEVIAPAPDEDKPAPAPTTPDPSKGSPDTGVEGVAAVIGVAALAAGAVIVSKKRR